MTSICEFIPRDQVNKAISYAIAFQGIGQFAGPTIQGQCSEYFILTYLSNLLS